MTRGRNLIMSLLVALFLSPVLVPSLAAGAQPPATLVVQRLEVRFTSATHAVMNASLIIYEYIDGNLTLPADGLRERLSAPGQEAFREGVEDYTARLFCETAGGIVPEGGYSLGRCAFDDSSLTDAAGTDEYHPPVVLTATGELSLRPASLGLPASADLDRLVPLLLSDGAWLQRQLRLSAGPGCSVVVQLDAFAGTIFEQSGSARLVLLVDNSYGTADLVKEFPLTIMSPSGMAISEDSALARGTVDIPDLGNISVRGTIEFQRADTSEYWNRPPEVRNITTVSGLTLSELVRSGLLSTDDLYERGIRPLVMDFEQRLASLFNVSLTFSPSWKLDSNLSCTVSASSSGKDLFSLDAELIKGALNAGAEYRISVPIDFGWPTSLELFPPAGMVLDGLPPGNGGPAGRTPYIYKNNGTGSLVASLASAHPASGTDDMRIEVVTDFYRPNTELGKLLWSQDTDVPVFVDALLKMGTISVPTAIAGLLPSNLTLRFVTSDLMRLLLAKKLIGEAEMNAVLSELKPRIDAPIRAALGRGAQPGIRYISASLSGYDLQSMNGSRPMVVEAWASGSRVKHLDLFKVVGASPGPLRLSQDFALKGVAGCNVTYRMRFAPELKLVSVDGRGAKVVRGNEGGRDFFEVSFGRAGGAANVTAFVEPSPGFLLFSLGPQLSPCFALLIIIGVVVFFQLRKWRRRRRAGTAARSRGPARPPQQT